MAQQRGAPLSPAHVGTSAITQYLRLFRNSKFLGRRVRHMLGDFGVPIAILVMVGIDILSPQV